MFITQTQSVIKVLVTMCMSSRFIRTEMFKQNRIISFINFIICLNLHESRISTYLLLTLKIFNFVELILLLFIYQEFSFVPFRLFGLFKGYCAII